MYSKYYRKRFLALFCALSLMLSVVACSVPSKGGNNINDSNIEFKDSENKREKTLIEIEEILSSWVNEEIDSENAINALKTFLSLDDEEITVIVNDKIDNITLETTSKSLFSEAQVFFDNEDYIAAIEKILLIDENYSQYSVANDFLSMCQDAIFIQVSSPSTIKEFEDCITLLSKCLSLIDDSAMAVRKSELENELVILKDIADITERAEKLYDKKKYKEAFFTLAQGLNKYPNNEALESNLIDFHDHYIIYITQLVNIQCEQKEYKEALKIIDAALAEYNCQEFELLREYVNELRNPLYKIAKDTVTKFETAAQGWDSEELDVKQLANDTGAYVIKSGKQLLLGDYSGENVTILSFGGNIIASIAGIDAVLDLRDLSYDLVHWGEDEYFAFYLAADVLALLPVIGVAKYFDHFKDAGKLTESVGDVIKKSEAVTEATDELTTVVKLSDDIAEVAANMKYISKYNSNFQSVILTNATNGYNLVKTRNSDLLGESHPQTGVEFVLNEMTYSDGNKIMGVFPKFESFADIQLKEKYYKETFVEQEKQCLIELQKETKHILCKYWNNFSKEERKIIQNGQLPPGYTWHHSEEEGLMQLVKTDIHQKTGHTGGMSLWGQGH